MFWVRLVDYVILVWVPDLSFAKFWLVIDRELWTISEMALDRIFSSYITYVYEVAISAFTSINQKYQSTSKSIEDTLFHSNKYSANISFFQWKEQPHLSH